jgi:hypothetical protein
MKINYKFEKKLTKINFSFFFIFLIFSYFYLPHVFILNEDYNLASSLETDPGSLISSLSKLFEKPYYNMFKGYHLQYYGWTWASITFFAILPFKILFSLFGINDDSYTIFLIRFVYFLIGLASVFALFKICNKFLEYKNLLLSFFVTNIYIFSPFYVFNLFYYIHPESTGILFSFLGIICVLNFQYKSKIIFFYLSIIFFALAVFSKQAFIFSSLTLSSYLFFLVFKKDSDNKKLNLIVKSKILLLIKSFFLVFIIFFLIHPYAIFFPYRFLASQISVGGSFNVNILTDLDYYSAINLWIKTYISTFYFSIPFILSIINSLIINFSTKNVDDQILNFLTIICTVILILLYSFINRANIAIYYFQVLVPISFIQILIFLKCIYQIKLFKKDYFKFIVLLFILTYLIPEISETYKRSHYRLSYKKNANYKAYEWAKTNLNQSDRIVIDHRFALPSKLNNISCHYWRDCTTYDKIVSFNPNYVAFADPLPVWGWSKNEQGQNLKKYVEDNNMKIINIIESDVTYKGGDVWVSDFKILIYHKN